MKISVLGSGGWGVALAMLCYDCSHDVVIWGKFQSEIDYINQNRETELLKGVKIPDEIIATTDKAQIKKSDIIIIATPSFAVRENAIMLREHGLHGNAFIVSVAKGFEKDSLKRFSQVISEELPDNKVVVLSGPSHAEEVARRKPTLVTAACEDNVPARVVQTALMNENFRIYTNEDIIGVETGAALKNVIAMAAGVCKGLGLGDNTVAALITRGIHEISKLGVEMGAKATTFAGLSGLGDLIVTCTSQHSRNRLFGEYIGSGLSVDEALAKVGKTVESYYAAATAKALADKYNVSMPIISECYDILYCGADLKSAPARLMNRLGKSE
ncbi:MAG: NAD(P)-dependent glycerol-3-phosphate dehydrogenase [Clostridia bacterium]|nr:NAD(P)-dependent glycerol-3-phosphate dehydrogenase [Clostridia bacterium]